MISEPPPLPQTPVRLSLARKGAMISAYVVAGFFAYMACLLAFIRLPPPATAKYLFVVVPLVVSAGALAVGLAASRFSRVRRDIGIVLTGGAGFTACLVVMMIGWMNHPVYRHRFDQRTRESFSDYAVGGSVIVILLSVGLICLLSGWRDGKVARDVSQAP